MTNGTEQRRNARRHTAKAIKYLTSNWQLVRRGPFGKHQSQLRGASVKMLWWPVSVLGCVAILAGGGVSGTVMTTTPQTRLDRPLHEFFSIRNSTNLDKLWEGYKDEFDKEYDPEIDRVRKNTFVENVLKIGEHNLQYDEGTSTYRMELNRFCDWTVDEFVSVYTGMGTRQPSLKLNMSSIFWASKESSRVKRSNGDGVDLRDTGCIMSAKDQYPCATCWAYTAVTSIEYSYCRRECGVKLFSEQELIDCSDAQGNQGCDGGGWYHFAWDYVHSKSGMSTASTYPHVDQEQSCILGLPIKKMTDLETVFIQQKNEDEMRLFIDQMQRPIGVALDISWEWMFYGAGIFDDEFCVENSISYHGLSIIGYGTENGNDYWIAKNSWGPGWGESGFMRLRRNTNLCGLADYPMGLKMKCGDSGYDCVTNSPCNAANRAKGHFYFTYSKSNKFFVQCGITDRQCFVMPCPATTKWHQKWLTCAF